MYAFHVGFLVIVVATVAAGFTGNKFRLQRLGRTQCSVWADDDGPPQKNPLSIPVLSPIPNQPPLMIGSDLVLDPPTPFQWRTIEEAVLQHSAQCRDNRDMARLDAAPIVALMESSSGSTLSSIKNNNIKYATIAAVVGMSKGGDNDQLNMIDLTDSGSFMESLQKIGRDALPNERRIRLVGIGRANLQELVYRVPTAVQLEKEDDEGYLQVADYNEEAADHDHDNPYRTTATASPDGTCTTVTAAPDTDHESVVITATFQLIRDGDYFSPNFRQAGGHHNRRPAYSSPVHLLNRMSTLANQIEYLHQDRRHVVRGLQAAKARLQLAGRSEDLEDADGLGTVFALKDTTSNDDNSNSEDLRDTQDIVDQFLAEFPKPDYAMREVEAGIAVSDNYGMGFTASSVTDIADLTTAWMAKLDPFYTPHTRSTETFYYEILSFVSLLSLERVLTPKDLQWSLECTNTVERLTQAYDWMLVHQQRLRDRADVVSQQLRDCGEECTDLW